MQYLRMYRLFSILGRPNGKFITIRRINSQNKSEESKDKLLSSQVIDKTTCKTVKDDVTQTASSNLQKKQECQQQKKND